MHCCSGRSSMWFLKSVGFKSYFLCSNYFPLLSTFLFCYLISMYTFPLHTYVCSFLIGKHLCVFLCASLSQPQMQVSLSDWSLFCRSFGWYFVWSMALSVCLGFCMLSVWSVFRVSCTFVRRYSVFFFFCFLLSTCMPSFMFSVLVDLFLVCRFVWLSRLASTGPLCLWFYPSYPCPCLVCFYSVLQACICLSFLGYLDK